MDKAGTLLSHVELNVSDYAKSIQFYDVILQPLGWRRIVCQTSHTTYTDGFLKIVLGPVEEKYKTPPFHRKRTGLNHLAFYAPSMEFVDRYEQDVLKANQIRCLYETESKGDETYYSIFFEDPDRIKIEIVYSPEYCSERHYTNQLKSDFNPYTPENTSSVPQSSPSVIPTLVTQRLTLRPFKLSDAKEVQRQAGHPKVAATTALIPHPYPDGAAEAWISSHEDHFKKGIAIDWALVLTDSNRLIGCLSLTISKSNPRAEIGYWIGEEFWNMGFCSEATQEAIRYVFEDLKLNKVTARHRIDNPASGKVMQKSGMEQEGLLKQDFVKNGRFFDMVVFGLTRSKWQSEQKR